MGGISNESLSIDEIVIFHRTEGIKEELLGKAFIIEKIKPCRRTCRPMGDDVCYGVHIFIRGLVREDCTWCSWTVRKATDADSLEDLL